MRRRERRIKKKEWEGRVVLHMVTKRARGQAISKSVL